MGGKTEILEVLLTARAVAYTAFQKLFDSESDAEQLDLVFSETVFAALSLFKGEGTAYAQQLAWFEGFGTECGKQWDALITPLKREYTRLFIGPASLVAPPWESVYVTKKPLLFQSSTLEVRACYRSQNFIPKGYPHIADDHIALELDFMARLSMSALVQLQANPDAELTPLLTTQWAFLREHLLKWVPEFAQRILAAPDCILYPEMTQLLWGFLNGDSVLLAELLTKPQP